MYQNVHAIVLHAARSGEHDKRLSIYTRECGRLVALASGAARPGAKLAAATEPCVESRFRLWVAGNKPYARITGGAVESSFPALRARWSRHLNALFLCEWTDRLTGLEQVHPEKYDLLRAALAALEAGDETAVRLAFVVQFLDAAGYFVGEEAVGASLQAAAGGWIDELRRFDFLREAPAAPYGTAAERVQERLLKFVSPLLNRPLRLPGYEKKLRGYIARSAAAGAA